MVILEASKGGASGRACACAESRAEFPDSQTIATSARAACSADFQVIAKPSKEILGTNSRKAAHIFYTHIAKFQMENLIWKKRPVT
jgi:hypothetical protein